MLQNAPPTLKHCDCSSKWNLTRATSFWSRFAASPLYLANWAGVADFNFFVIMSTLLAVLPLGFFFAAAASTRQETFKYKITTIHTHSNNNIWNDMNLFPRKNIYFRRVTSNKTRITTSFVIIRFMEFISEFPSTIMSQKEFKTSK